MLVWLSVVIEVGIVVAVLVRPNAYTFSILALWPWVPHVITVLTGGDVMGEMSGMSEMNMSLYATAFAMLAYAIYERGFYPRFLRKGHLGEALTA